MSKLQSYTLTEVLKAFVPAFLALLLIMLLGFCIQLLNEGLDVVRLRSLPHHIANFSVPWVLPAAFLTAVIMAFGRLAADNEIIAVYVGGVHLFHIMAPVFAFAIVLSAVAGYFHFETVPRARQKIERLKYHAIKQILRDRVALSAQRQFTFYPATVQYEDFEDGRMKDVLILESRHQSMPRTVISAKEGSIIEDVRRPGYIKIVLTNCSITQLAEDEIGGRGTSHAGEIEWGIRVAPELASVGRDVEHLPFGLLMDKYEELTGVVSRHPQRFRNPDEKEDTFDDEQDNLQVQLDEMQRALEDKRKKLERLQNVDQRARENVIAEQKEQVEDARETLELLKGEQRKYARDLQELRAQEEENYEKITELQKKIRQTNEKKKQQEKQIEEAQRTIAVARRQIEAIKERTETIRKDIPALETEVESIQQRMSELAERRERAETQKDLRELRVRIHRRLALSVAVFMFAMIGMPLGIMTRRRSSVVAFGIGFAIMLLLFYPFLIFGQIAAEVGMLPVVPAMWSGNAVTFAIGGILMIKVFRR